MTKSCPVLAVLLLGILSSARRFGPVAVKKEEITDDALGLPRSMSFPNHEIIINGAEAHQNLQPYKEKLEEIGAEEVLMEHGLGQISELDAERIVNAAEGMVGSRMNGGRAVSDIEAQKIMSHYEDMLEEIGAKKVINDVAHSSSESDAQAILGKLDSQAASSVFSETKSRVREAQHSASPHKRNAQEIRAEKTPLHSGSALFEKEAHKIVRDGGGNHHQHYHPTGDARQMASKHGSPGAQTEGLLERDTLGLAPGMHLDGSPVHASSPRTASGDNSKSGEPKQALSEYRKTFSESEIQKAQNIISKFNEAKKSAGEYDKVISESEAQKIITDYNKKLADFWGQKTLSNPGVFKKFSHSEGQDVHGERKVMETNVNQALANSRIEEIVSAPSTKSSKSNSSQKYNFDKTFDDFKNIVDDIGSEKSQAIYRDLLESLAGHTGKVDSPGSLSKPMAEPAPVPFHQSSLAQVQEVVTENKNLAEQTGIKA